MPYLIYNMVKGYAAPRQKKEINLKAANLPDDVFGDLPAYVEIEDRINNNRRLTDVQERSAFQAEFLRHWRPGEDKSFVVGMAHTAEIKYFLKNGVNDELIKAKAIKMAELCETDRNEYYKQVGLSQAKDFGSMVIGGQIGMAPWFGLMMYF